MTELIFLWFTSPSLCISPLTIQQKLRQGHRSLPIKSSCLRELVTPSLFLPPLLLVSLSPSLLQVLWHWNILVPLDAEHSAKKSICFGEICLNPIDFWKIDLTLFLSAYKTSCLIFFIGVIRLVCSSTTAIISPWNIVLVTCSSLTDIVKFHLFSQTRYWEMYLIISFHSSSRIDHQNFSFFL